MAASEKGVVRLTDERRHTPARLVRTGTHPAALLRRARVLLKADTGGLDATLHRRKPAGRTASSTGSRRPS